MMPEGPAVTPPRELTEAGRKAYAESLRLARTRIDEKQYAQAIESLLKADAASTQPDPNVLLPLARAYEALGAKADGCQAWLRLEAAYQLAETTPDKWMQDKIAPCRPVQ